MKSFSFLILGLILGGLTIFPILADDKKRDKRELEPSLAAILKNRFPEMKISRVDHDRKRGEKILLVRLNGETEIEDVLVKLSDSGEILKLDEDIKVEQVPERVRAGFRKAFPDAEIKHSEKVTEMEITYRFDIEIKGRKNEVEVSRSGRISGVTSRD